MHLPALSNSAAYQALQDHTIEAEHWQMRELFAKKNPDRFFKVFR
ncbi:hypothetical protein ACFS07_24900 [Undibacterium arcticum]